MTPQTTKLNPEQDRLRLWQIAEHYAHNEQVTEAADILRVAHQLGQTTIRPERLASQEQVRAETPFGYQSFSHTLTNDEHAVDTWPQLPELHEQLPDNASNDLPSFHWMTQPAGPTLRASLKGRGPRLIPIVQYRHIIDLMHKIQQANPSLPIFSIPDVVRMVDANICAPKSARQTTNAITSYLIHQDMVAKNHLTHHKMYTITAPNILDARHDGLIDINKALNASNAPLMKALL